MHGCARSIDRTHHHRTHHASTSNESCADDLTFILQEPKGPKCAKGTGRLSALFPGLPLGRRTSLCPPRLGFASKYISSTSTSTSLASASPWLLPAPPAPPSLREWRPARQLRIVLDITEAIALTRRRRRHARDLSTNLLAFAAPTGCRVLPVWLVGSAS